MSVRTRLAGTLVMVVAVTIEGADENRDAHASQQREREPPPVVRVKSLEADRRDAIGG
jgi:hypothetical protein